MEESRTTNAACQQGAAILELPEPFVTVDLRNERGFSNNGRVIVIASVIPANLAGDMEYRGALSHGSKGFDVRGLLDSHRARGELTPCGPLNCGYIPAYFEDLFEERDGVYTYTNAKGAVFPNQAISYDHLWGCPRNGGAMLLDGNYMVLLANFLDVAAGGRYRGVAVNDGVPSACSVDICALTDLQGSGTLPFVLWRGFTGLHNPIPRSSPAVYANLHQSALPGFVVDAFQAALASNPLPDHVSLRCGCFAVEGRSSAEMALYANYADPRLRKLQLRATVGGAQTPLIQWIGEAFSFDIHRAKVRHVVETKAGFVHSFDLTQDLILEDLSLVPQAEPMCKAVKSYMDRKWSMDVALWLDFRGEASPALPKPSPFAVAASRLRSIVASKKSDADLNSLMRFDERNPLSKRADQDLARRRAQAPTRLIPGDSGGILQSSNSDAADIEMESLAISDDEDPDDHSFIEGYEHGRHVNTENLIDCESKAGITIGSAKGELINRLIHSRYPMPVYKVQSSGPPHAPVFVATGQMEGPRRCIGHGCGRSKTQAENMAALSLLLARPFRGVEGMGPSTSVRFEKMYRARYGTGPYILYDTAEGGATATLEYDGEILVGVGEDNYAAYLDLAEGVVDRYGDAPYTEL